MATKMDITADGTLFFAGSSSGGADEKGPAMQTFDSLLKDLCIRKFRQ